MKSFQYKARDMTGQVVEGILETDHFSDAKESIRKKGLELISLEELRGKLNPFIFEAVDDKGEKVQGAMMGKDEEKIKEKLEKEFGIRVENIHPKAREAVLPQELHAEKTGSGIVFSPEEAVQRERKSFVSDEKLKKMHGEIQTMLSQHAPILRETTKAHLRYLDGKIDLLRSHPSRKHWFVFRWELKKALRKAEREVRAYNDAKWRAYEASQKHEAEISYGDIQDHVQKQRLFKTPEKLKKIRQVLSVLRDPHEQNEEEVLLKQQYESIWIELQRFTGVLFGFYLACYFTAYYLKNSGVADHVLIRLYDAMLFQQCVAILFSLFSLLTIRTFLKRPQLWNDAIIAILFVMTLWAIIR